MADPIKRSETSHICETNRTARGSVQWFAENLNLKGKTSHPITHNNALTLFINGEQSFADIADQIGKANSSIDLCCWGFDPGMELLRTGHTWPRGPTYGDLLVAAARRGVKVRLLIWHDAVAASGARNMPGHTHDTRPWKSLRGDYVPDRIGAHNSLAMRQADQQDHGIFSRPREDRIHAQARAEYCHNWYQAALHGLFGMLEIRLRSGNSQAIAASLASETRQPGRLGDGEIEGVGLVHLGTHHQKPILIDYAHDNGDKAVGYVMGLNALTDYWCTSSHLLEDPRREQGGKNAAGEAVQHGAANGRPAPPADAGFLSMKPYQDYACRIDGGGALACLHTNFVNAWDRAIDDRTCAARSAGAGVPSALRRARQPGHSSVQIVRTQPEEGPDKSIKDIYFQATDIATLGGGYLYLENQYFQYEDWSRRLIDKRNKVVAGWNSGRGKAGKSMEDMPLMHVFIVIPVPERVQMVPRTYDALAVLGQQEAMTGQSRLLKETNAHPAHIIMYDNFGNASDLGPQAPPEVVRHANTISKPDAAKLESAFGLKVATAMLQTSAVDKGRWRYREIYIHSKLLLVDDSFFTLGSANLNQRSMAVDSEINIATDDPHHAADLRRRIFSLHSGGAVTGGSGSTTEITRAFVDWTKLMRTNKIQKSKAQGMSGFLLPLEDNRSSTMRLS